MTVIIAGSRTIADYSTVAQAVMDSGFTIDTVISGRARGVDRLGEVWANRHRITVMPADWTTHGRRAGFVRNAEMAKRADALIAVWDGKSAGTRNMIRTMQAMEKPVYVHGVVRG